MKEYLMTLISVALLSGTVGMLSPEGEMKRYVRLLCSLCLLCAMVGPALSLLGDSDFSMDGLLSDREEIDRLDYDEIYHNSLILGGEKQAADTICAALLQRFELSEGAMEVSVRSPLKNDTDSPVSVTVLLRDEAIFVDPKEILSYVRELGDFQCTIVYE